MKTLFLLCAVVAVVFCKTSDLWWTENKDKCFNIIHDSYPDSPPKTSYEYDRANTSICCKVHKWSPDTKFPELDTNKDNEYNLNVVLQGFSAFIGDHECTMETKFSNSTHNK